MSVKFSISFKKPKRLDKNNGFIRERELSLQGNNGSSVILIHGLTGTPYEMLTLAKSLNKTGYSTTTPLLANHGEPIEVLKNTKWQDCYETVRKAFLNMASTDNGKTVFAIGLSVGALFALLLAEEFKEKVSGISCLAPVLFYDGWNVPRIRFILPLGFHTFLKNFFYFKEEPPYGIKNEAIRERIHRFYATAALSDTEGVIQYGYPYIPVNLIYQHYLLVKYVIKRLPNVTRPVQLIQAEEDDIASTRNSHFIYNRVNSKIKDMKFLKDSYHVITADQERDKVAQEVERFFARIKNESR